MENLDNYSATLAGLFLWKVYMAVVTLEVWQSRVLNFKTKEYIRREYRALLTSLQVFPISIHKVFVKNGTIPEGVHFFSKPDFCTTPKNTVVQTRTLLPTNKVCIFLESAFRQDFFARVNFLFWLYVLKLEGVRDIYLYRAKGHFSLWELYKVTPNDIRKPRLLCGYV